MSTKKKLVGIGKNHDIIRQTLIVAAKAPIQAAAKGTLQLSMFFTRTKHITN